MSFFVQRKSFWALMSITVLLISCAKYAPVPGGSETVNRSYYTTHEDLIERLRGMAIGMSEAAVFNVLGHGREDLIRLKRDQVITALYGSTTIDPTGNLNGEEGKDFLRSLSGYSLNYKIVKRKHGFSSPIRIRTDEQGFDYTVTLVFRDGFLYSTPILTGGVVNRSSSKTFFDYLEPNRIIERTPY